MSDEHGLDVEFDRKLGLFDATMIVAGAMIGSGIFLVSAEMSRLLGSPAWLLAAWIITGVLTVAAALSYAELAAMMPRAGGQYVFLRESLSPIWGFLYVWTFLLVIQSGTIAAVGSEVRGWKPGDRVSYPGNHASAELLTLGHERGRLWRLPDGLDFEKAFEDQRKGLWRRLLEREHLHVVVVNAQEVAMAFEVRFCEVVVQKCVVLE